MLNPKNLQPGQEQHEYFSPFHRPQMRCCQYDYRHHTGELFSCVRKSLEDCRAARDNWLKEKAQ